MSAAPDEYGHVSFELSILYGLCLSSGATAIPKRPGTWSPFETLKVGASLPTQSAPTWKPINVMKALAGMRVAVHPTRPDEE
ncbi:MAG: hypothetical protein R2854_06395 [Caldilineaceae bacterium]